MAQKNQNQTKKDLRVGTSNVRSLYRAGAFKELVKEADGYSLDLVTIQESRWPDGGVLASGNFTYLYGADSGGSLGTGFLISKSIIHSVKSFKSVNDRLSYIIIEDDKEEEAKDLYCKILEQVIDQFASYDTRIVLGDFNAKIGRKCLGRLKESLHEASNGNGIKGHTQGNVDIAGRGHTEPK
ncbi:hypothetical protein TSAR_000204 [Trichomalopsis sarcophagae]|uniref:Endonuclease/exonuclease/phosphatase domain-containing protein n=1 Tax=Trichomalopsis sarcophagae TaxID=543379 RepID=A0A232FE31_9HYME|nr:hypothetical protein TSAR_000204 [Trichomalopsis sarcophagae]